LCMALAALAAAAVALEGCGGDPNASRAVTLLEEGDRRAPAAANIPLDEAGKRVLLRWVAADDGVAQRVLLRVKVEGAECEPSGREGYARGSSGVLAARMHPVAGGTGRPDESQVLATARLVPCDAHEREGVGIPVNVPVRAGQQYAIVVRNADPDPRANWFSLNMLYAAAAAAGPHGRDERAGTSRAWWTGLDPREVVGFDDGSGRFRVPGGPYGEAEGRVFLPTYLVDYGNRVVGQPFYWALPARGVAVGTLPAVSRERRVRALDVLLAGEGRGVVELRVRGTVVGRADVTGSGVARAELRATLPAGEEVEVRARVGPDRLPMPILFADPLWANISGGGGLPAAQGHRGGALPIRVILDRRAPSP
jgi:hypothetical protein